MLTTRSQQKRQHLSDPIETSDGRNKRKTRNETSKDGDRNNVRKTLNTYTATSSVEDPGMSSESDSEEASEESDEDSFEGMGVLDDRRINALAFVAVQNDNNAGRVVNDENDGRVERVAGAGQIGRGDCMSDRTNTSATVAAGHLNTGGDMECTATRSAYDVLLGFMSSLEQTCAGGDVHVGEPATVTGQGNQLTVTDDAAIQIDVIRGLSHRAAPLVREKFMSDRVNDFVKTQLFRKVKFISSVHMCTRALVIVMDALKILPPQRPAFSKMYESCVKGAINTKRSTCEQAGAKIVKELLIKKQHKPDDPLPPFDIQSLEMLRQCYKGTEEDLEAYVWFFGSFMECVSGKRGWGKKKYREEVSKAQVKGVGEMIMLVTVCDEAFALLLYENYIDKWMKKYHTEREITVATDDAAGNKEKKRMKGKFTKGSVGHCEFGGWSELGVRRYNELCGLARRDRQDPQANKMEKFLLNKLQVEKYGDKDPTQMNDNDDNGDDCLSPAVEAYCEI